MATTIEITDPQTIRPEKLVEFYQQTKGRCDVWIEDYLNTPPRTYRVGLFNDPMFSFPNQQQKVDDEHYRSIGADVRWQSIFDLDEDAQSFARWLDAHKTQFTTTFDMDYAFTRANTADGIHDWLAANIKGRAMLWATEGDEFVYPVDDNGDTDYNGDPERLPWILGDWTRVAAIYDPSDPNAYPADAKQMLPFWNMRDYEVMRIMFTHPNDAMLFRLTYAVPLLSRRNGIEESTDFWSKARNF